MTAKTVNRKELARIYQVTPQTIDNWRKLGMPSIRREGMHRRYDLDAVSAWLSGKAEGEVKSG